MSSSDCKSEIIINLVGRIIIVVNQVGILIDNTGIEMASRSCLVSIFWKRNLRDLFNWHFC